MTVTKDMAVGELRLLRAWKVRISGPPPIALRSTYTSHSWEPGENTAICMPQTNNRWDPHHKAPEPECHCGLYGVFNITHIPDGAVLGVAEYWGRVRMGARGIRAEHARVVAIAPRYTYRLWFSPSMLASIGYAYNVEVYHSPASLLAAQTINEPSEFGLPDHKTHPVGCSSFGVGD